MKKFLIELSERHGVINIIGVTITAVYFILSTILLTVFYSLVLNERAEKHSVQKEIKEVRQILLNITQDSAYIKEQKCSQEKKDNEFKRK